MPARTRLANKDFARTDSGEYRLTGSGCLIWVRLSGWFMFGSSKAF
jgi:hypothetical protein